MPGEPWKADITKSQHLFLFMGGEEKKMQSNSNNTVKCAGVVLSTAGTTAITTVKILVYMDLPVNTFTYLNTILVLVYIYLYSFSLRSF